MNGELKCYKAVMNDGSEVFFGVKGTVKVNVEIHPEDENVWTATDEDGNVVFLGQGVRYICWTGEGISEGKQVGQ